MRLGVNTAPADLPATLATFPGMAACRVFAAAGKGIPAWTSPTMATLSRAGVTAWPSFRDDPAAVLPGWLDAMPTTVPRVWLTWHHEPEGDLASADYRAGWRTVSQIVRAHRNSARVTLVPIHTLFPARHKVGDAYSPDWTRWTGVWQQWAPTDAAGRYLGDAMGWDCYLATTATSYESPVSLFRIPVGAATQAGVPLVIPELGAVRVPGDAAGTGRATWITACLAHLAGAGVQAVNWWHATGTNGADYRLSDTPSRTAWQTGISGAGR